MKNLQPTYFQKAIFDWYDQQGRHDLPWQKNITPYRVWISEIMLQQTQVTTVIPYYDRFMQKFPNVRVLASASLDNVLHQWTGLGYYARARNLHRSAKIIVNDHHNKFPNDLETLQTLPGIGRSTAGAILAIAYQKSAPILDGNVKRVLTRFHAIEGWPGNSRVQHQLWEIAERYTSTHRVADYTQAMMDLGATVCTRTSPSCHACPLNKYCCAYAQNKQTVFPQSKSKKPLPVRHVELLILCDEQQHVLLEQRPPVGLWGGLWCFPECPDRKNISTWCRKTYGCELKNISVLPSFRHTFSHFHWDITPIKATFKACIVPPQEMRVMETKPTIWYDPSNPESVGLAAPIKRLLMDLNVKD